MAFESKQYLDPIGLEFYDGKIKEWVDAKQNALSEDIVADYENKIETLENAMNGTDAELQQAIDALEALVGEGTVDERVAAAVAQILDSAPETFDTLKEVADWIDNHGQAASALVAQVAELEQSTADRFEAVDERIDEEVNAFQPIANATIEALFLTPVMYDENLSVTEQIAALAADEKLVIDASTTPQITEDIVIENDCTIVANDVEFTGTITVNNDVQASVIGAIFSGQVVVQ